MFYSQVFDDAGGGIFTTLEHGDIARQKQFTAAVDRFFTVAAIVGAAQPNHTGLTQEELDAFAQGSSQLAALQGSGNGG